MFLTPDEQNYETIQWSNTPSVAPFVKTLQQYHP